MAWEGVLSAQPIYIPLANERGKDGCHDEGGRAGGRAAIERASVFFFFFGGG